MYGGIAASRAEGAVRYLLVVSPDIGGKTTLAALGSASE